MAAISNQTLSTIISKVADALSNDNVTAKVDTLIALRAENAAVLAETPNPDKPTALDRVYQVGKVGAFGCIATAVGLIFLAPAAPAIVPLIATGLVVGLGTGIPSYVVDKVADNKAKASADTLDGDLVKNVQKQTLVGAQLVQRTIDLSVAQLVAASPDAFSQNVKSAFNKYSAKEYEVVLSAFQRMAAGIKPGV